MGKLLYVEDDAINALVMKKLLSGVFSITHVFDGEACVDQVGSNDYDAILMDINLGKGKMDGVQTLHKLRTMQRHRAFIVVAVTSYALPEDRDRFLQEGFDAYMAKPVDRSALILLLNQLLNK